VTNCNLYIIADIPHLLKSLKACILNNKFFLLPENIVRKYNLPINIIQTKRHFGVTKTEALIRLTIGLKICV